MVKSFFFLFFIIIILTFQLVDIILYVKKSRREVNDDNMVFKNISAEFLEDTVILVSTYIVQRHDICLDNSKFRKFKISHISGIL